jgi:predicted AAA+ superfamily ATPase
MNRLQLKNILSDLEKKMVFLIGPRQAGKTWLAKEVMKNFKNSLYLNYDSLDDKKIIDGCTWNPELNLIIFDEIHKKTNWKNYIKGVFDTKNINTKILITGSARLDVYDQLGDSLAGRYFRHRLLPFSYKELLELDSAPDLIELINRGGFPEPFLSESELDAERWRQQYTNSLLSTDVFEFDRIQNLKALRILFNLLRKRVGSPISYQSLAEDLEISPNTVKRYIEIFEALFIVFRITPYSKNIARSILKEPKIYFFDTGLVDGDEGAKFENLIALSLLKSIYGENDYLAKEKSLHYLRTKDGTEIDFAVANKDDLEMIIEAKLSDKEISKSLINFSKKYQVAASQVVQNLSKSFTKEGIKVETGKDFLGSLYL